MNQFSGPNNKYNLEERTAEFGENIIELAQKVPRNVITTPILNQIIRSGTSIGANYYEANNASSKIDFRNKIYISKKETNETKFWLRMLVKIDPSLKDRVRELWQEAQELNMIFQKIISSLEKNKKKS